MISPTLVIEGQIGESVTINCTSPYHNGAFNNILEIYSLKQNGFVVFHDSPIANGRLQGPE